MEIKKCIQCGKDFTPCRKDIQGIFCSRKCSAASRKKEFIFRNGYACIHDENHPNCTKQGYVPYHRHLMETKIGRILNKNEIVHHMNHIKTDNRIENLMILSDKEHKSKHARKRVRNNDGTFS